MQESKTINSFQTSSDHSDMPQSSISHSSIQSDFSDDTQELLEEKLMRGIPHDGLNRKKSQDREEKNNSKKTDMKPLKIEKSIIKKVEDPSKAIHLFYYAWYTSPPTDAKYYHWNHRVLPHWTKETNNRYPEIGTKYDPRQDEIGSAFYPLLGAYSSNDRKTAAKHFAWMKEYNIGTMVLSWWGANGADGEGLSTSEDLVDMLFEEAKNTGISIAFHLEPYENRSVQDIHKETKYLIDRYGNHEAMYKVDGSLLKYSQFKGKKVPLFYVYDSYHISSTDWESLLNPTGSLSIRNTDYDAVFLSLYLSPSQSDNLVLKGYFDGIYTYFVSKRFTYGSNPRNWEALSQFCVNNGLVFSPSIGPGYNDKRVRPWNYGNTESRDEGKYYQTYFDSVMNLKNRPTFLSLTSFNEWHEGTNIEPAKEMTSANGYEYERYSNNDPFYYMKMTSKFSNSFALPH